MIATPTMGFDSHFINLVVSDLDQNNILINGMPVSAFTTETFKPIANSGFSGMQLEVPAGSYVLESALPMSAYVYGVAQNNSYA